MQDISPSILLSLLLLSQTFSCETNKIADYFRSSFIDFFLTIIRIFLQYFFYKKKIAAGHRFFFSPSTRQAIFHFPLFLHSNYTYLTRWKCYVIITIWKFVTTPNKRIHSQILEKSITNTGFDKPIFLYIWSISTDSSCDCSGSEYRRFLYRGTIDITITVSRKAKEANRGKFKLGLLFLRYRW